jgi:hypothetical protein
MSLNSAVLTATFYWDLSSLRNKSHAWGVLSGKNGSQVNQGDWNYKTFSLQCYFAPFHSFKDLVIINEVSFIQI